MDLLLKLLPEESRRGDSPVIYFSQTVTRAVSNIPDSDLNPFAVALSSTSTASGSRKIAFCGRCGHFLSGSVMKGLCPNPACGQPFKEGHVVAAGKRSHQWCVSLTPNNTKTIGRMTCPCLQ